MQDLTRIESGNETAFNDPFDLRSCIQDATRVYASEAKRRNLEFEVDLEGSPDCMVLGDLRKIRTVVANLVANAVKYTSEGRVQVSCRGREPTESGRSSHDSGMLDIEIIVSDTGRGIASDKLEAMFVTFEQAETAPQQSNSTGLGLGLAVVARIVEQLGGQLRAESEVGVGTRFYFTLLMAKYTLEATDSTRSTSSPAMKHLVIRSAENRIARSNSIGSDGMRSVVTRGSGGSSEIDTFVEAFSASHVRGSPDDQRIAQAEARMKQPGTFPVTDSSYPIRPQKPDTEGGMPVKLENRAIREAPSSPAPHRSIQAPTRKSSKDKHGERDSPDKVKTKRSKSASEPLRILVVEVSCFLTDSWNVRTKPMIIRRTMTSTDAFLSVVSAWTATMSYPTSTVKRPSTASNRTARLIAFSWTSRCLSWMADKQRRQSASLRRH